MTAPVTYLLTLQPGGSIRIERAGFGQTIPPDRLFRDGPNAITSCAALIEVQIAGREKKS